MKFRNLFILLFFGLTSTQVLGLSPDYSSPEGVVETFYKAIQERNLDVLAECIHPESKQRKALNYHSRNTSEAELEMYQKRLGEWGSIMSVDYDNPHQAENWVRVKVEFYKDTGESQVFTVYVMEYDMGFRIISF